MKKALCFLLTVMLIFQMVTPAFAYTQDTINNTTSENLTILDSLQSLYGDELTEDDVLGELSNMGLIDNEGNLNVSQSIMVDGSPMTLVQLKALLYDDEVDLSKMVSVDGTELTLSDLKVMLEIEDELSRIKETYLSGSIPFTEEHEDSFDSLLTQIQNDGIMLEKNMVTSQSTEIAINHDVRLRVSGYESEYSSNDAFNLKFSLTDINGQNLTEGLNYDVSFDWIILDGSAKRNINYIKGGGAVSEGTVTLKAGELSTFSIITIDFTGQESDEYERWYGDKVFLIQLYNPVDILFYGDKRAENIAITMNKDYEWITSINRVFENDSDGINDAFLISDPTLPINFELDDKRNLEYAIDDISGSVSDADFLFDTSMFLISAATDAGGYMMATKAMILDEHGDPIQNAKYGIYEGQNLIYYDYPPETKIAVNSRGSDALGQSFNSKFSGSFPECLTFTDISFDPDTYDNSYIEYFRTINLELIDNDEPTVKSITAPAGAYYSGQAIPILVEFSEPVKFTELELTMQGESSSILPAESANTTSKFATFLYTVPKSTNNDLVIDSITGIEDILGNTTSSWPEDNSSTTISGITMEPDPLLVFESLSLVNEPDNGYLPNDTIEIKLEVDTSISQWLENEYNLDEKHLESVYIKAGSQTYPLTMGGSGSSEGSFYTTTIPASNFASTSSQSIAIELYIEGNYVPETHIMLPEYIYNPAYFDGGSLVIGMSEIAEIVPLILVEGITHDISLFPVNNIIYSTDSIKLNASVSPTNASFSEIKWESSDETIALIDEVTGAITPVSKGEVTFKAISNNGGMGGVIYSEPTPIFTVINDGPPTIVFPKGNNAFVTKKNEKVNIAWNQNLIDRTEGVPAIFNVELYDGNFSLEEDIIGSPVYTATITDISRYTIPISTLGKVSTGTTPAYTVKVSAANPEYPSEIISDIGYIIVYPQPAKVYFDELDTHYITDDISNLNIRWTLSEFVDGDFEFTVVKNQDVYYKDTTTNGSGSYNLDISPVAENTLKDIYTVTIKAKNTLDNGWSTDSFVLHVYNKNSLNILVDGQDMTSVSIDNNDSIKSIYQLSGSEGIIALNRNINLKNSLSINYNSYPWGNITDQIKWKSSDSGIASVNYRQGTLYENVEKFNYSSYRPSTEFMLAGNADGITSITATHAATGMKDALDVNVDTLKDKLYIFNFYPKQQTTISYTNGNGENRNLTSNTNGEIAIYEETGILSNISLKSGSTTDIYLGTLYNEKLISSEGNPGLYELYPVNIFKLRSSAKVELFLKDSDGKPYTGQVTYRGAVYKNRKLCSQTMEQNGKLIQLNNEGRFTLNLDSTKFWVDNNIEELKGIDKLEFIYELIISDNYYPQLITVNGNIGVDDIVKFGESVVNLKPVTLENSKKPFILSQSIDYNLVDGRIIDVTNYTGSIGPGNTYTTVDLETLVAWWGRDKVDGYDLKLEDEFGSVIEGQKAKTILYPFATLAYTKNESTLTKASLNLGIGEKKKAAISIYLPDGSLLKHINSPFTFTNMVGAPKADDSDKGVEGAVKDLKDSGDLEFDPSSVNTGDDIIGKALNLMTGTTLGNQVMNLKISATKDPNIYQGLITMYQGIGDTGAGGLDIEVGGVDSKLEYMPDPAEMMDLLQKSTADLNKELDEAMNKTVSGGVEYGLSIKGYFEVEVRFDADAGKWIIVVVGGGFDLDSLIGYTWTMNTMAGPIPLTGELGLGAAVKLEFRAIKPYGNVPENINAAEVNDFLTALRLNLYIKAFGGFGFDYSIVAIKIGVFGQINLRYDSEFLNRPYLYPHPYGYDKIYAMGLGINGEVGIKFLAKLLFISYEAVLASKELTVNFWEEGDPDLIQNWKNSQDSLLIKSASSLYKAGTRSLSAISEDIGLESRDYLELYDRSWGSNRRSRSSITSSSIADIQTNAYPYANPIATRDGAIIAYMSDGDSTDVNETRASWANLNESRYIDQGPLHQTVTEAIYADNNLKLDGTGSFAVAAWEQQGIEITSQGTLSFQDIAAMINSSDIIASVYDGRNWTTTTLTDNLVSDLSPVVAANDGRAIVAWRSVAGSDMSIDPLTFDDVADTILYRVYDNSRWSETYTLYNGTSGNVKGISAAMMPDGTAAVTYTLDLGTQNRNAAYGYETICAVIGSDNSVVTDIRLTNNNDADENPQIAVVDFGIEGYKFVIGWHSVTINGVSDIKFAALDKFGTVNEDFIDSISSINENSVINISDTFRFVKGEDIGIDDLSLIWIEPTSEYDDTLDTKIDKDCIRAVRFMRDINGKIYLTSSLDIATMEEYTVIDHLDAYSTQENTVNAVMLASSYIGALQDEGNGVYTVDPISYMKSASGIYKNDINIQDIYINFNEIKNDLRTAIQFTISNMGITPIDSINIELMPDNIIKTFDGLNLLPNQAMVFTVDYDLPGEQEGIHDLNYTVAANFSNLDIIEKSGFLNLDIPDTGISKVELISDEQGKRVIQATLQNLSDVPLEGSANRKVYIGFYINSEITDETKIDVQEITGDDLSLLDESSLTMRFNYTIPADGIPKGGIRLYGKIWVEEKQPDNDYDEIIEFYPSNNERSVLISNPIEANNGDQFLVTVEHENDLLASTGIVTVKNLSMIQSVNGNVIAYLLDSAGNVIETKLLAITANELLILQGEESVTKTIVFTKLGASVKAEYFTSDPSSMDVDLSDIKMLGIDFDFDRTITNYSLSSSNLYATTVVAASKRQTDLVEIRNTSGSKLLASGIGAASYTLKLPTNNTATSVQVIATDTITGITKAYYISVLNKMESKGSVLLSASDNNYTSATVTVLAENIINFNPNKWQYMKDGTWSELFDWNPDKLNKFVLNGVGTYSISARLFDESGYYMDSNNMTIVVRSSSSSDDDDKDDDNDDDDDDDVTIIDNGNIVVPDSSILYGNFIDVPKGAWYYDAVNYLSSLGIINGIGNNMFAPEANVTRADFLIMVMNAFKIELDEIVTDNFIDAGNKYYTLYLGTAKRLGLVSGIGNNLYSPGSFISRQDMAVILYRILDKIGKLPTGTDGLDFSTFKDAEDISDYAINALKLFMEAKVLSGYDNILSPKNISTRAQAAQILYNLMK